RTSGEKRVFLVILFTSFSGSLVSRIPGAVHKGLHIHFVGYLNGQSHRSSYLVSRLMGDIWRRVTEGNGYYHWCRFNKNYPVNINHVIHYSDHKAVNALRYAISYLAKREQKECGIILKCSGLPEKSNRGRPRLDSPLPGICALV
ncbi:hypothetical protein LHL14_24215, partial [Escherichia coli]|nr:hypothetical protein [Escherichia coli]